MIKYFLVLGSFLWINGGLMARIDPDILLQSAKKHHQSYQNEEAGILFSLLEKQSPTFDDLETLHYGAEAFSWLVPNHQWSSINKVIQHISKVIPSLHLKDKNAKTLLGKFLFRVGEAAFEFGLHSRNKKIRSKGIEILEKAVEFIPESDKIHVFARVQLGQLKRISGRKREAYGDFQKAKSLISSPISKASMRVEQGLASYYLMYANQRSSWLSAREHITTAKAIAAQIEDEEPADHYLHSYITGRLYNSFFPTNIELAKEAFLFADTVYQLSHDKSSYVQFCENGLASSYYDQGQYLKAIEADKRRLKIQDPACTVPSRIITTLSGIGSSYQQIGEHGRNLIFQQSAIDLLKANPISDTISYYNDYGLAHNNIASSISDSTEKQIFHLEQALVFLLKINPVDREASTSEIIATIQANLAFSYSETQSNYPWVLQFYRKAIESFQQVSPTHHSIAEALANQARIQHLTRDQTASATLEKAERFPLDPDELESKEMAEVYNAIGKAHLAMGNHTSSKVYFEKSLHILVLTPTGSAGDLPAIEDIVERNLGLEALKGLAENLEILGFEQEQDSLLNRGLQAYQKAIALTNIIRQQQTAQISQVRLSNQSRSIFESAIHLALILHSRSQSSQYLHQAFELAEQSRGLSLLAAISAPGAAEAAGVPDSILISQKELQTRYDDLRRKKSISDKEGEDGAEELNLAMREITTQQDAIAKFLKENYPKYYGLMYESGAVDLPAIQADLKDKNSALIEYFYTEKILFTFVVTPDTLIAYQKAFTPEFEEQLNIVQELQTTKHIQEWADRYWANAYAVYQFLLGDLNLELPETFLIIPDDRLNYLAFDALVTEPQPDELENAMFHELPYLVYDKIISYDYSYTIRQRRQPYQFKESATMLAMAPSFKGHDLAQLPMSRAGVVRVGENFHGITTCLDHEATEATFTSQAARFDIVDLATHGEMNSINSEDCMLHFSQEVGNDGKLHLGEIYNINLNIRMAVLEACESGMGPNARGEGVMSLARGFSYAGCRTIVTSLWKVPEEEVTGDILNRFYKNLAKKMPVDAALTSAKRSYLLQFRHSPGGKSEFFSPFFWSEMVVIGDTSQIPLEEKGRPLLLFFLGGALCLIFLAFLGKNALERRKKAF